MKVTFSRPESLARCRATVSTSSLTSAPMTWPDGPTRRAAPGGTEWDSRARLVHDAFPASPPRLADERRGLLRQREVGLLQRVGVAVVDRPAGVAHLMHAQFLVHARVLHQRVAGVLAALVQGDDWNARVGGQLLESLGHVIGVQG